MFWFKHLQVLALKNTYIFYNSLKNKVCREEQTHRHTLLVICIDLRRGPKLQLLPVIDTLSLHQ